MRRAAALVSLPLLLAACGGDGSQATTGAASRPGGCADVAKPDPKPSGGQARPKTTLDPSRAYRLAFTTSCGRFTVTLDLRAAPRTSASLVSLARKGFFDGTVFHRIVPGFVIQGGDPTGTGAGGPGYATVDPPPGSARYTRGVVAMAKTQTDPPGSAGSQFFVVTGADVGLPPEYAVVGRVTEGLAVVRRIGRLGDPATEQPTRAVVVEHVAVQTG